MEGTKCLLDGVPLNIYVYEKYFILHGVWILRLDQNNIGWLNIDDYPEEVVWNRPVILCYHIRYFVLARMCYNIFAGYSSQTSFFFLFRAKRGNRVRKRKNGQKKRYGDDDYDDVNDDHFVPPYFSCKFLKNEQFLNKS